MFTHNRNQISHSSHNPKWCIGGAISLTPSEKLHHVANVIQFLSCLLGASSHQLCTCLMTCRLSICFSSLPIPRVSAGL